MAFPYTVSTSSKRYRVFKAFLPIALVLVIVAVPYLVPTFRLSQISGAMILALAVVGLNLLSGYGGLISIGHSAFFGLGAYTTGVMVIQFQINAFLSFAVGVVLCFLVGVIVSLPALRVTGVYLVLVTLAAAVLLPSLVRRFEGLTGGSAGMYGVALPPPEIPYFSGAAGRNVWLYYLVTIALVIGMGVVYNIMHSRMGRAITALRDNETAAIVSGVNRTAVRTTTFGLSAAITGMAGCLFAVHAGVIMPDSFTIMLAISLLIGLILGGRSSTWGPVLGGFIIYFVPVWTSELSQGPVSGVIFGALCIAAVFLMPLGLAGVLRSGLSRLIRLTPEPPAPVSTSDQRDVSQRRKRRWQSAANPAPQGES